MPVANPHRRAMLPRCSRLALAVLAAVGLRLAASAASPSSEPPEARQFDFWLGDWEVTSPDGRLQGTSRVERVAGGRGLLENWSGDPAAGNDSGKSLNTWNATTRQWQQFWVGSGGQVLALTGGLDTSGRMVLNGTHGTGAERVIERITWTPNADGTVRQLWERSADGGKTWQTAFDGRYAKKTRRAACGGGGSAPRALYYLLQ